MRFLAPSLVVCCLVICAFIECRAETVRTFKPNTVHAPVYITSLNKNQRDDQVVSVYNKNDSQVMSVWISAKTNTSPPRTSLYGLNLDSSGIAFTSPTPLYEYSSDDSKSKRVKSNPSIDYNPYTDEYLIAYQVDVSADGDQSSWDIYGLFLHGNGTVKGKPFSIKPSAKYSETNPKVTALLEPRATYPWIVVWEIEQKVGSQIQAACLSSSSLPITLTKIAMNTSTVAYPAIYYNPNTQNFILVLSVADKDDKKYDLYSVELVPNPDKGVVPLSIPRRIYGVLEYNDKGSANHASSIDITIVGSTPITIVWQVNGATQTYVAAAQLDDQGTALSQLVSVGTLQTYNKNPSATVDYNRNQLSIVFEAATQEDSEGDSLDGNVYLTVLDAGSLLELVSPSRLSTGVFKGQSYEPVITYTVSSLVFSWTAGEDAATPSNSPKSQSPSKSPSRSPSKSPSRSPSKSKSSKPGSDVSESPSASPETARRNYHHSDISPEKAMPVYRIRGDREVVQRQLPQQQQNIAPHHYTVVQHTTATRATSQAGALAASSVSVVEYITEKSDGNDHDRRTATIVLVIICIVFGSAILIVAAIILVIVIKYRQILRERLSDIREGGLPSLPRGDGFEQL
eukprot:TRINITY_DN685_c0_g1_i1.p1 TRINITY_DN685_c0_g1~~TRINITY_DN685_c0_g1_i1.p1  ORF type:complete len:626 (-),score=82.16 TRINITY_DN685_c0_g1_i1:45-1922(-)